LIVITDCIFCLDYINEALFIEHYVQQNCKIDYNNLVIANYTNTVKHNYVSFCVSYNAVFSIISLIGPLKRYGHNYCSKLEFEINKVIRREWFN
jgi:hypothetical protein